MSHTPSRVAPPIDTPDSAQTLRRTIESASAVLETDDVEATDEDGCPSCDAQAIWQVSRRHRFSPFGSVLLATLAFWSAIFGWLLGFGYMPSLVLLGGAVFVSMVTRKAEVCEACGFVRRQRAR